MQRFAIIAIAIVLGLLIAEVIGAVSAFRGARDIDAIPTAGPAASMQFMDDHNRFVGGEIARRIFTTIHPIVLGLLFIAGLLQLLSGSLKSNRGMVALIATGIAFISILTVHFKVSKEMDDTREILYSEASTEVTRANARGRFDHFHSLSERIVTIGFLSALTAVVLIPLPATTRGKT